MQTDIPKLKHAVLTGKILLAVKPEVERKLKELKHNHRIDISEWLRQLIAVELPKLESRISA